MGKMLPLTQLVLIFYDTMWRRVICVIKSCGEVLQTTQSTSVLHKYQKMQDICHTLSRGLTRLKILSFIKHFYAIMYKTTIVQNKIISTICSWLFFCLANIYRPSLGKVQLSRPNPKLIHPLNFYLRRKIKKNILLRIVCTTMD